MGLPRRHTVIKPPDEDGNHVQTLIEIATPTPVCLESQVDQPQVLASIALNPLILSVKSSSSLSTGIEYATDRVPQ